MGYYCRMPPQNTTDAFALIIIVQNVLVLDAQVSDYLLEIKGIPSLLASGLKMLLQCLLHHALF